MYIKNHMLSSMLPLKGYVAKVYLWGNEKIGISNIKTQNMCILSVQGIYNLQLYNEYYAPTFKQTLILLTNLNQSNVA